MWNVECSCFQVFKLCYSKVYVIPIILFSVYTKSKKPKNVIK